MTFDAVNRSAVVTTTVLLAAGLATWLARGPAAADPWLDAGLIALMMTPVLRLVTTLTADVRRRDTVAVATSLAVCVILGVGLALALGR
ncbi:MAG: hypothetical protein ABIU38_20040 [Vicinamibacteraceae bacterium]